jgi:aminoglycoside 6-adenylyltransferase
MVPADAIRDLIKQVTNWSLDQPDVRAAVVLGSQARSVIPADCLSDLDMLLIVRDASIYLADVSWLSAFGEPCLTFVEPTAVGSFRERRVLFRDGADVDFALVPVAAAQQLIDQQIPAEIADVFRRGFKILVDKDRLADQLTDRRRWPEKADKLPTESMWEQTGQDLLYHVVWAAKKAKRGELWVAKSSCDGYQKNLLLRLIEWHAKIKSDRGTWHRGRFLERWADPVVLQELPSTFAEYALSDVERALLANLRFYERFGREVANRFGYAFPDEAYAFTVDQVKQLVGENG